MPSLELDSISLALNGATILDAASLAVPEHGFVVILGPSGCGKSTLLRVVAGLLRPDSGRVLLDGVDLVDTPPQARDCAMVFQSYALYPHLTVRGNLAFPLKRRGLPKDEIGKRVDAALAALELTPNADKRPGELSGGQRQRTALGRAMVRAPKIALFDEPLSNLDPELRVRMRAETRRIHAGWTAGVLYVTHDRAEAMALADLVAVMDRGRIVETGPPDGLWSRPRRVETARFLGFNVVSSAGVSGKDGSTLTAFRPEACALDPDGPLELVVDAVEPLGPETVLRGRIGAGPDRKGGEEIVVSVAPGTVGRDATTLRLRIDPTATLRFDATSGARIE